MMNKDYEISKAIENGADVQTILWLLGMDEEEVFGEE